MDNQIYAKQLNDRIFLQYLKICTIIYLFFFSFSYTYSYTMIALPLATLGFEPINGQINTTVVTMGCLEGLQNDSPTNARTCSWNPWIMDLHRHVYFVHISVSPNQLKQILTKCQSSNNFRNKKFRVFHSPLWNRTKPRGNKKYFNRFTAGNQSTPVQ